ncbi:MAG: class II glutamine amidotransferase [Candidatus Saccharicenans sp.]|jgi:glutamine amidotransferase|nr:class II glutamine amidotransferase [Candidatus Saccharicenans sp.]MDH7574682.1 class II glutamine amidotransferase [Candidatus Saccharicenans sp.]
MCRLLGLIANKAVDLEFSLGRFKKYAASNQDGWGIGWYENGKTKVYKEAGLASDDPAYDQRSKEVRSKIIIAHVRQATEGESARVNSHPFQYESWLFAHNGSVSRESLLGRLAETYKKGIKGQTDSEVYFRWILQCISEKGNVPEGIKKALAEIAGRNGSKGTGGLNFLMSDGLSLYAFRFSSPGSLNYYSLYYLFRNPGDRQPSEFISKETSALVRSKSLAGERAVLVCSEKLTDENWQAIKPGQLLVVGPDLELQTSQLLNV